MLGLQVNTDHEIARTLSIVRELAQGKKLILPDGYVIGMGRDMTIGYVLKFSDGERVSGLGTMDLAELNRLCNLYGIGSAIPDVT